MNDELLLHKVTNEEINSFVTKPTHALIIEGKNGIGKSTVASYIAAKLLNISTNELLNFPQLHIIQPLNSSISINEIRKTQHFLKLKTTGHAHIRRIVIVEKAEFMTVEAQNAFLKILEEPPKDTVIMILTGQKIKLLPTIRSRAQLLTIKPVSEAQINSHFNNRGYKNTDVNQAYNIAGSKIGIITSLLGGGENNEQLSSINLAKKYLTMNKFERLANIDELAKDKIKLAGFIEALITVSQAALKQTLKKDSSKQAKSWHRSLELSIEAEKILPNNPNTKLLLTDLLLNL